MLAGNTVHSRKERRPPPYGAAGVLAFVVLLCCARVDNASGQLAEQQASGEELGDDLLILMESTPYSISFSLNDTDHYELQNVTCKNIKFLDELGLDENVCDNLSPCSTYLATLIIKHIANENVFEKTVDASTSYTEPTVNITGAEAGVEEIYLTWAATDKTCIDSYQIEVKSPEKDFKWTFTNDMHELNMTSLNPCQEYYIELKTYNSQQNLVSNETRTVTTLYAEPEDVTVSIESYGSDKMKVSWNQPTYKSCIDFYYLRWYKADCFDGTIDADFSTMRAAAVDEAASLATNADDVCEWSANLTDASAKEHIITGLQGCEMYIFELYINSNETLKSDVTPFTSPEQVPGVITAQTADINETNITLKWHAPLTNSKCVQHYQLTAVGPLNRAEELQLSYSNITEETAIFFGDLDPCGKYNFSVAAVSLNGTAGHATHSSLELLQAQATPVQNVFATPDAHSVMLSWDPPAFADLCISSYRLAGWNNETSPNSNFDTTTTNTSLQITGLISCLTYTVQIIPITNNGQMDGKLERIDFETEPAVALQPYKFESIALYPNALELSAKVLDVDNKCKTIFARFVCETSNKTADVPYKLAEKYVEGKVGDISFGAYLSPLSPNTEYLCSVALFNVAGWSSNKSSIETTPAYYPDTPRQVNLTASTNYSVQISWKEPKYANGNIKLYLVQLQRVEAAYYVPPSCSAIVTEPSTVGTSSLATPFTNLFPYTRYSIQLAAQNEYGVGEYTRPYIVVTQPYISDPVTNLKVLAEGPFESDEEYKANVLVSWTTPCKSNGEIEYFELEFVGERQDQVEQFHRSVAPEFNADGTVLYNETNLKPEYNYVISVAVRVNGVNASSTITQERFDSPAGIPDRLSDSAMAKTRVSAYDSVESNNPTSSAVVYLPSDILESDSGSIIYMALLLSEKGCNTEPQMRFAALNSNTNWPEVRSWTEVYNDTSCITQYQTTPSRWSPAAATRDTDTDTATDMVYVIGADKCDSSLNTYCNGPLKADTEYYLVVRLFTRSGYNDAALLEFRTDSLIQLTIILISVCSCLLLALIAGIIYLWVTKRIRWKRDSSVGIEDSFGDIVAKNFAIYYREISKPEKIAREFKELTTVAVDLSCSASELGCNKNRYADIFPYDKNRVILDIDADGSDYINASFIDGYRRKKEYIATQGPKPESVIDFWRMVLQHNVRVIVMVTQFRESDVIKCHEYYPYKSKGINVVVKKKDTFELYDRTEMSVTHDKYGLKQKVVHFYFKKWPDHGCPSDPMNLITFVRKVKTEKVPSYSPIVIHCSAGVGRTGTFIALDIIMQRLKNESKINIYESVKKLRFQRMKMVQSISQYTFLYNCMYELVKHKLPRPPPKFHNKTSKKVSFEDDEDDAEIRDVPCKQIPTIYLESDLHSVGVYDDDETDAASNTKPTNNNPFASIPIWNNHTTESAM